MKGKSNQGKLKSVTQLGQCVSVDQLESMTPGLIAKLKGRATRNRYQYVTVFINHFSSFLFIYLQKCITSEEMVRAKIAFEAYSKFFAVCVLHYHADSGQFADNAFLKSVAASGQSISFCGVNAHFQNGRAEKCICDLQDLARTRLIHAKHHWPMAVEAYLWPYAVHYANAIHNLTRAAEG